ncbi:DLA class II histocompatibility antigen, DR-1 beta chain [Platysternon megacephalum]|uniref:DLA class II histocompatibility antigen, DR-1 beta chain n=1 Tax=Platysternon megacephalum TaxID=55544 RepID=A0A4D9DPR5_9SAUR|nr:DLA class II histocompatibility antigen, DR-1 beta chain [Platysternon megacephalum]
MSQQIPAHWSVQPHRALSVTHPAPVSWAESLRPHGEPSGPHHTLLKPGLPLPHTANNLLHTHTYTPQHPLCTYTHTQHSLHTHTHIPTLCTHTHTHIPTPSMHILTHTNIPAHTLTNPYNPYTHTHTNPMQHTLHTHTPTPPQTPQYPLHTCLHNTPTTPQHPLHTH